MRQGQISFDLFEDLYRAKLRQSLYELEAIGRQIGELPQPLGDSNIMAQEALRGFYVEALTEMEGHLAAMRAKCAAWPELPARKEKEAV